MKKTGIVERFKTASSKVEIEMLSGVISTFAYISPRTCRRAERAANNRLRELEAGK